MHQYKAGETTTARQEPRTPHSAHYIAGHSQRPPEPRRATIPQHMTAYHRTRTREPERAPEAHAGHMDRPHQASTARTQRDTAQGHAGKAQQNAVHGHHRPPETTQHTRSSALYHSTIHGHQSHTRPCTHHRRHTVPGTQYTPHTRPERAIRDHARTTTTTTRSTRRTTASNSRIKAAHGTQGHYMTTLEPELTGLECDNCRPHPPHHRQRQPATPIRAAGRGV